MRYLLKSPLEDAFRLTRALIDSWEDWGPRIKESWHLAEDDIVQTEEGHISVKTALGGIEAMQRDVILKFKDGTLFVLYDQVFDTLFKEES